MDSRERRTNGGGAMTAKKGLDLDSIMVGIEEYLNETDGDVEVNIVDDGEGVEEVKPLFGEEKGDTSAGAKKVTERADEQAAPALKGGVQVEKSSKERQGEKEETELPEETLEPPKVSSKDKKEPADDERSLSIPKKEGLVASVEEELEERTAPDLKKEDTSAGGAVSGEDASVPLVKQEGKQRAEQVVQDEADELEAEEETPPALKKEAQVSPVKQNNAPSEAAEPASEEVTTAAPNKKEVQAELVVQDEADELEAEEVTTPALKKEAQVSPVRQNNVPSEASEPASEEVTTAAPKNEAQTLPVKQNNVPSEAAELKSEEETTAVQNKKEVQAEQVVRDEADELEAEEVTTAAPKEQSQVPPVKQSKALADPLEKDVPETPSKKEPTDKADEPRTEPETAASIAPKEEAPAAPVEKELAADEADKAEKPKAGQRELLSTEKKQLSAAPVNQERKDDSAQKHASAENDSDEANPENNVQDGELQTEQQIAASAEAEEPPVTPAKQDEVPSTAEKELASEQTASSAQQAPAAPAEKKLEGSPTPKQQDPATTTKQEPAATPVQQARDAHSSEPRSILDRDTHDLLHELETLDSTALDEIAAQLQRDEDRALKDAPLYIYTSLAGGGFHMVPRTNRLATILTAHRAQFQYRDLGTDPEARSLWKRLAHGKQLPGLVRGDIRVIGNWEEVEELNEEFRLREML